MPPSPTPTPAEVERVREAARLLSLTYTQTLVDLLTDAQWAEMLLTLDLWDEVRHDDVQIGGRVQIDPAETRLLVTNEVRERLGLPPFELSGFGSPWVTEFTPNKAVL